jgi:hypothetical protein
MSPHAPSFYRFGVSAAAGNPFISFIHPASSIIHHPSSIIHHPSSIIYHLSSFHLSFPSIHPCPSIHLSTIVHLSTLPFLPCIHHLSIIFPSSFHHLSIIFSIMHPSIHHSFHDNPSMHSCLRQGFDRFTGTYSCGDRSDPVQSTAINEIIDTVECPVLDGFRDMPRTYHFLLFKIGHSAGYPQNPVESAS